MKVLMQIAFVFGAVCCLWADNSQGMTRLNPCGNDFNYYLATNNEALVVVDNDGAQVFKWMLPSERQMLGCGKLDQGFYVRTFQSRGAIQEIVILDEAGRLQRKFEVMPLRDVSVFETLDVLLLSGHPLTGDGRALSEHSAAAYSLRTGKRVRGDLPEHFGLHGAPMFAADRNALWLGASVGDTDATYLVKYDRDLKEQFRKKIAGENSTAGFVSVEDGRVYGVTSVLGNREAKHSLFVYTDSEEDVRTVALEAFAGSPWVRGLSSIGHIVVWNEEKCTGIDLRTMREQWSKTLVVQGSQLSPDLVALDGSGRLVLRERVVLGNRPLKLFVVESASGNLARVIELDVNADGYVKHGSKDGEIIVVSGKNESLLFRKLVLPSKP